MAEPVDQRATDVGYLDQKHIWVCLGDELNRFWEEASS